MSIPPSRAAAAPALAPVFIHSGWRCSSTYVWSRFRRLAQVRAYYEPWHEQLADLTHERIAKATPKASGLRHPGGDVPYLTEFCDLLAPDGGVRGYRRRFALDGYFLDPDQEDAAQQAYLEGLSLAAQAHGRRPVLACCRTLGRIAWLRRRFGGFHIVLIRDPVQQWLSFHSLRRRPRPTYFELCQYVILSEIKGQETAAAALLDGYAAKAGDLAQRIAAVRRRLKRAPPHRSFAAFLAVYLLSYLRALPQADLVIDVDRLARDEAYARSVEAAIAGGCGLAVDFSDCRAPPRHAALAVLAWRKTAAQVVAALHLETPLARPGWPALLNGKLVAGLTAVSPDQALVWSGKASSSKASSSKAWRRKAWRGLAGWLARLTPPARWTPGARLPPMALRDTSSGSTGTAC